VIFVRRPLISSSSNALGLALFGLLVISEILQAPRATAQALRTWDVASGGNGYAYELVTESLTWHAAAEKARQRPPPIGFAMGNLASIHGVGENNFLGSWAGGWIGFSDHLREGEWRWNDGTPGVWQDPNFFSPPQQSLFTAWNAGEPNNFYGNEDFAIFNGGSWNDGSTSPWGSYIIKYAPSQAGLRNLQWAPLVDDGSEAWTSLNAAWLSGTARTAWQPDQIAVFSGTGAVVRLEGAIFAGGLSFSSPGYSLVGGTLALSGSQAIVWISGPGIIASVLTGTSRLGISNTSSLTITGTHTHSGDVLISQGTLRLGDGTTANGSVAGNIVTNTRLEFANASPQTFSGAISGSGEIVKQGPAVLVLDGINSYSGTTTISQGVLRISGSAALPATTVVSFGTATGPAVLDLNNTTATIAGLSGGSGDSSVIGLGQGGLTISQAFSSVFAGAISGSGSLTKTGPGQLTLAGTHSYTGGTTIIQGTLRLGDDAAANGVVAGNITNNAVLNFANATSQTFANEISGSGSLTKTGPGQLTLAGTSSYSGGTTISQGTLRLGDGATANGVFAGSIANNAALIFANPTSQTFAGAIGGSGSLTKTSLGQLTLTGSSSYSGGTTIAEGTLQLGDGENTNGFITGGVVNNSRLVFANPASQTFAGAMSGSGSLTKTGPGQLTLTGTSSYSGGTTISQGTLRLGNGTTANGLIAGDISNEGTLAFANTAGVTFGGLISGGGSLTKSSAGTLTLTRMNTFTGPTTVSAGTLQLGDGVSANGSVGGDVTLSAIAATLAFNNALQQSFVHDISGVGGLTKSGSGALSLLGVHTYSGATTIAGGTLRLSAGGSLPSASRLVLSSTGNAAFDLNNQFQQVGPISGGSRSEIVLRAGQLTVSQTSAGTFSGVISGSNGSLVKIGSQTLTLTNTNTYTGLTTVSEGVLRLGNGVSGGSVAGNLRNDAETIFANPTTQVFGGLISGTGVLTKASEGTLVLTGSSTFQGVTRVNEGVLQFGNAQQQGSIRGAIVNNSSVVISTSSQQAFDVRIEGGGSVEKVGFGTTILTGSNTYTGPTLVTQGTLQLGNAHAISSSAVTVATGATLSVGPQVSAVVPSLVNNGLVDVSKSRITVISGQTATGITAGIVAGRSSGSWNGASGITSSAAAAMTDRAVGWCDNGDGSFTVGFAAAGDLDMNGLVDLDDVIAFVGGGLYDTGSPAVWAQGDYDYNGIVDLDDVIAFVGGGLYDKGPYLPAPSGMAAFSGESLGIAAVPEPSTWVMIAGGIACASWSAWRRRTTAA
jgi:fibronectin-binding autotransporter adhesin